MKKHNKSWIPNLLTLFNLFLGFWAIILTLEGNYLAACWLVIIASICDGLDGKIARYMRTSSEIGLEIDSLADVVSFGVAPGLILYSAAFYKLNFLGVLLAAIPALFGAWRLARYNSTNSAGEKKPFFEGMPIPMQANFLVSFLLFNHAIWGDLQLEALLIPMVLFLALLMISHIPFDGIPKISFRDAFRKPWRTIFMVAIISLLAYRPVLIFFPVMVFYVLRGLFMAFFRLTAYEEDLDEEDLDSELEIHRK